MKFSSFAISAEVVEGLKGIKFFEPTEIQAKVIPEALKGKNIIGQSKTGSGKTHAFLVPIFNKINKDSTNVEAIILSPTRELAEQIYNRAIELNEAMGNHYRIKRFTGGMDRNRGISENSKQPHIVIGTPGRISDLAINNDLLKIHQASTLVVDEADMALETGFINDIDQVASTMKKDLQMMVFSATIPEKLKPFLRKYLGDVVNIQIEDEVLNNNIEHILIKTKEQDKRNILLKLLNMYQPFMCLIFTNTKTDAKELSTYLNRSGFKNCQLHGDLSPRERKSVMKRIRNLEYQYIVCTDIAARGIDIEGVSHIISMDIPRNLEFYIHRSGRTARFNFDGKSVIIYNRSDEDRLNSLEKIGIEFNHKEFKKDELIETKIYKSRSKRTNDIMSTEEKRARSSVKKAKKVKPGYKKKYNAKVKRETQKLKRRKK